MNIRIHMYNKKLLWLKATKRLMSISKNSVHVMSDLTS